MFTWTKKGMLVLGCLLLIGGTAQQAGATATTLIWAPSTDIQVFKKVHLTSDFYVPTENNSDGSKALTITNLGLTAGVLPFKKLNAEVGFDHKSGTGVDNYPMYFNTKVGIPEEAYGKLFPGLVAGIYDVGTKADKTDFNVWYFRAGKTISVKDFSLGRFSAGYFQGNAQLLTYNGKESNEGVLIGWDRAVPEISDRLWFCVDYQGSKSAYGAMNVGFSYKVAENVYALFGYDIYNNKDLANTFTAQIDIDF
jgi:hypothetical protein